MISEADKQTLPIGYYPTLSDDSLDKILLDESQYTVEWMITSGKYAKELDLKAMLATNSFVSYLLNLLSHIRRIEIIESDEVRSNKSQLHTKMFIPGCSKHLFLMLKDYLSTLLFLEVLNPAM